MEKFLLSTLNGITLAALYFIVASGFSLIFGVMRIVNLAHGALYLGGAYIGWEVGNQTDNWWLGLLAGAVAMTILGIAMQVLILRWMEGEDLRQALITIGIGIIIADQALARYGGFAYQFPIPGFLQGATEIPILDIRYPTYRLFLVVIAITLGIVLWLLLSRTKLGITIRAGIDDRNMLSALGVNVQRVFVVVFGLGAFLAGLAGTIGGTAFSIIPGEDSRFLLASLVVVIVGGMGSLAGAAVGALLVGIAGQYSLAYTPTYAPLITFALMTLVLAIRPRGILGREAREGL